MPDSKKPPFPPAAGAPAMAEHVRKAVGGVVQRKVEGGARPVAEHVQRAIGGAVQRKVATPGERPVAAHVQRALGGAIQPKRPAVVQRSWSSYSDYYDGGSGQDAEMYLYEQQKQQRAREALKKKIQTNATLLNQHKFRFYTRNFSGVDALIANIIEAKHNLPKASYGVSLIEGVISAMSSQTPPPELSPDEILNTKNDYRTSVLETYSKVVQETSGKTDTQLGLMADYVTYS